MTGVQTCALPICALYPRRPLVRTGENVSDDPFRSLEAQGDSRDLNQLDASVEIRRVLLLNKTGDRVYFQERDLLCLTKSSCEKEEEDVKVGISNTFTALPTSQQSVRHFKHLQRAATGFHFRHFSFKFLCALTRRRENTFETIPVPLDEMIVTAS